MGALATSTLAYGSLVLVDSAPIIYVLEGHPTLASRYRPLFERHDESTLRLAITTATIVEVVLTGPFLNGEDALVKRYRRIFQTWTVVELSSDIAEAAARIRAKFRLNLADAVQAASALAINAAALVTHDRDFARLRGVRVLF